MMVDFLKKQGYLFICLGLLALLVIALFWALSIGTVKLPLVNIYNTVVEQLFSGQPIEGVDRGPVHDIVWLLRLPRLVLAALVGMGLSVCGVIMQAVVKNPLADPYILGISSGASLGATAAILLGIGVALGENFVGIAAFIGAFAMSLGVLFISNLGGRSNSVKLLLAGMALSAVCGAFSSFIVYFANNKEGMQTIAYWMMGSFAGLVVPHVIRMLVGTDHKKLIPVSALTGAVFLVIADGLCRVIIPRTELPIGILISLIGAPCFVYLMIKKTYGFGGN